MAGKSLQQPLLAGESGGPPSLKREQSGQVGAHGFPWSWGPFSANTEKAPVLCRDTSKRLGTEDQPTILQPKTWRTASRGHSLSVLDLPPVDASELLPHQKDACSTLAAVTCSGEQTSNQQEAAGNVLAAVATVLQWLTRADGSMTVGVEGSGPLLGKSVLKTPVPVTVPYPSTEGGARSTPAGLAADVAQILRDSIQMQDPNETLANLAQRLGWGQESPLHHEIFQVLVAFEGPGGAPLGKPDVAPLTRIPARGVASAAQLAFVLVVQAGRPGPLTLRLTFCHKHVSKATATALLSHICRVLEMPAKEWSKNASEVSLISKNDQDTVLSKWSVGPTEAISRFTAQDGGDDICLHQLFENRRLKDPSARAIIQGDLNFQAPALSYANMDAWATHLALKLRHLGVKRGDLVALFFERSPAMIVSIYAVLKAGGCYCPCDVTWPADRLRDVLEGGTPRAALCPPRFQAQFAAATPAGPSLPVVPVDEAEIAKWSKVTVTEGAEQLKGAASSNDPCYVFFTSGSTGKPKGVVVEHRGVVHRCRWLQVEYGLGEDGRTFGPGDCSLLKHAYTFGLSEWEIFWPLSYGAAVVSCNAGAERDLSYMVKLCQFHRVPVSVFVPSALQAFMEAFEEAKWPQKQKIAGMLRQIIACGEPLRPQQAHLAQRHLNKVRVDNVFGPTEGEMTRYVCPRGRPLSTMPVGRPIDGSVVYVLGQSSQLCGPELPGELSFAGPYIARGYLGAPQLSAEKFIKDPFSAKADAKMYKTGDMVRWRSDGELVFVGRADFQVKIRGFRIELGDIESAVRAAGGDAVSEAVVDVDASRGAGSERLVAHVGAGATAANPADSRSLEKHILSECTMRLPAYMVPALVVVVEKLPRNANGKVDRKALVIPKQALVMVPVDASGEAAAIDDSHWTATERGVRDVWAEVLNVPANTIQPEETFFAGLGGNSLLAGRVTAVCRKNFNIDLPGTTMYTHSTVKRLAAQVDLMVAERAALPAGEQLVPLVNDEYAEYKGYSCTSPMALIFQFFGVILVDLLQDFGPQAFCYVGLGWAYYEYGITWWMPLFMTAMSLAELFVVAVFTVVVKWLVLGRCKKGSYPLWGLTHLRWWLVDRFMNDAFNLLGLLAETPILAAWYRLLGAKISGKARLNHPKLCTPDLVDIRAGVEAHREVTIGCAHVYGGMLHLDHIVLGEECELETGSYVTPGTNLPPRTRLLPMSTSEGRLGGLPGTTEPIAPLSAEAEKEKVFALRFASQQDLLRVVLGLPWMGFVFALPYLGSLISLKYAHQLCKIFHKEGLMSQDNSWGLFFYVFCPVIITHAYSIFVVAVVVLQKRLLIGKLAPGLELGPPRNCHECTTSAWLRAHWDTMRHWMHARCVTSRVFEHSLEPLVNSELLSGIHRLLGAKVGRRVQSDNFKAVEHDCITIEDFVVFGSVVTMNCDSPCPEAPWRRVLKPIVLQRASNCLDHSQLMPGVTVGEAAVLGTRTLAHQEGCFPPDSISTGAVSGRSVLLRTEASQSAPPKDRAEELRVMRQLDSSFTWISFNLAQVLSAFLAYVLPQFAWVIATDLVFAMEASLNDESHLDVQHMGHADTAPDPTGATVGETVSEYWMIWFAAFFAIEVGLLMLAVVLKWLVMGTYKAENHTFFSNFHYRWAIMLNFKGAMAPLADHLTGTAFQIWYYRAMGAKIGKNAYIAGIALEFDLLELGDGAAINDDCDATAHTVERMVLKMAPVKVEANASIFPGSVVMPGGLMEKGSLLLERSQVLKGDVVRAREVWAGQPAKRAFGSPK